MAQWMQVRGVPQIFAKMLNVQTVEGLCIDSSLL